METVVPVVKKYSPPSGQKYEVVLGVLPFLVMGLASLILQAPAPVLTMQAFQILGALLFFGGYLFILYGLLRGWLLGFPRWVYPYLVYGIVFAFYISNAATPGLAIFGIPLFGRELWGWRAFVPLGIVVVLALVLSRPPWANLERLAKRVWNDWTLLSFGLYGLMMITTLVTMDEVERSFRFPPTLLAVVLVILGAWGYIRLAKSWQRMAVLVACAGVSMVIMQAAAGYFWQTHTANFTTGEYRVLDAAVDIERIVNRSASGAGRVLLILLAPLPLGLLHWLRGRFAPRLQP